MKKTLNNKWGSMFFVALFVGGFLSLFASPSPDGLEKIAESQGSSLVSGTVFSGIVPKYRFPGVSNEWLATSLAGILGTLLVFFVIFTLGRKLFAVK